MSKSLTRYLSRLIALIAVMALGGLLLAASSFSQILPLDFKNYLSATRMILQRQNPYGTVEFFAPPWVAILMFPFARLPINLSASLWILLNYALVQATVILSLRWFRSIPKWLKLLLVAIIPALMPGVLYSYITGQISPLANFAVLLSALSIFNLGPVWLSIIGLLLTTVKPHIVALPVGLCLFELARRRQWRVILLALCVLVILCLVASILLPGWLPSMLNAWAKGDYKGGKPGLVSPGYVGLGELGIPFWVFLPLVGYILYRWWQKASPHIFALALVANLLIVPYSRSYDFVIFIFPLMSLAKVDRLQNQAVFILAFISTFILPFSPLSVVSPVILAISLLLDKETPILPENIPFTN